MDKEKIIKLESENDGQTVNLFYDDMAGVYVAYGLSAYYVTMVTDPFLSYSMSVDMPLALLNRGHVLSLRQSLTKQEHVLKDYYRFRLRQMIGDADYGIWKDRVLKRFSGNEVTKRV